MSLINHLPKLETEGHWDSELIGTSIRFPKAPELWTEEELSALYRANGLDTADSSSRIEKAQEYWERMLSARSERIEHDVTYNAHEVRPECALEQPLEVLASGINYSYSTLFELSDKVLTLLADIEHSGAGEAVKTSLKKTDNPTVKTRINNLVAVDVPGLYESLFGFSLSALGHNHYEIALPSFNVHFEMTPENFERTLAIFDIAEKMAYCVLEKRGYYVVPENDLRLGGEVKLGVELTNKYMFADGEYQGGVSVKKVSNVFNVAEQKEAQQVIDKTISGTLSRSMQDNEQELRKAINVTCALVFKAIGALEKFIQEFYPPENPGSLPHYESLIESEPKARRLIEKSENSHGSVIYRVFYNDITSNKLVIETSDWLFALKVYLGHRDINGSMNLGLKAS